MIAGVNVKFLIPGRLSDKNRPTLLMDVQNRLEYDNFSRGPIVLDSAVSYAQGPYATVQRSS